MSNTSKSAEKKKRRSPANKPRNTNRSSTMRASAGISHDSAGARRVCVREAACLALLQIEEQRAYSHVARDRMLATYDYFDTRDQALMNELIFGTIERQSWLDARIHAHLNKPVLTPWVRVLLRMSVYQLSFLDRIPAHAVVFEAVRIAKIHGHEGIVKLVNAVLRRMVHAPLPSPEASSAMTVPQRLAWQHAHPLWLCTRWVAQWGEDATTAILRANNTPPQTSVRLNRLRADRETGLQEMRAAGWEAVPSKVSRDGIVCPVGSGNMAHTPLFQAGKITIQDESSMVVADVLDVQPGMRVLDCCAAPGGKTTHLAERMQDCGLIVACDIHPHKQARIDEHVQRLGLTCIQTYCADANTLGERFEAGFFDRILIDAPCSGFGVIRRKPDLKWNKREEDLDALIAVQRQLLASVHTLLRPGGVLVYSTCTFEPSENDDQIDHFLRTQKEFSIEDCTPYVAPTVHSSVSPTTRTLTLLPGAYDTDGFYIARLRKSPRQ